ncbi:MAG: helix-turn-helix domain-containing protein [Solirubrobacteraceae bacterium]
MATAAHRTRVRQTREESRARIVDAAARLLRERSYAELTVDEVMREAGQGRTLFYRHFDDLADVLARASAEAIEALYAAQRLLGSRRSAGDPDAIRGAMGLAADVYLQHGPLLRGVAEAAAGDPQLAEAHREIRQRFDQLAARWLADAAGRAAAPPADPAQTARALNLMNEAYLLDAFGREPRVTADEAARTLTEVWLAVIRP